MCVVMTSCDAARFISAENLKHFKLLEISCRWLAFGLISTDKQLSICADSCEGNPDILLPKAEQLEVNLK